MGDFIQIDFTGRIAETGKVFDTTKKEVAEKGGIKQGAKFGPRNIILGEGFVLSALEEEIIKHGVGDGFVVELPPERAFGKRDAKLIKLIPRSAFKERNMAPFPGQVINVDNILGIVRTASGGRITVDFNHPLAGKKLVYEIKIIRKIEEKEEKLRTLTDFFGLPVEKVSFEKKRAVVLLKGGVPEQIKKVVAGKMQKHINLDEVDFIERFKESGAEHG